MPIIFVLKLFLVPGLICFVTWAGRWWGPKIAGWLSAFPIVSGPILFIITMEHGKQFAITAATGTLSAVSAIIIFGIVYAWTALKFNWIISLVVAFLSYALAVFGIALLSPSLHVAAVIGIVVTFVAPRLFPLVKHIPVIAKPSRYELPLRMAIGALLVLLITNFAHHLGPHLSGVLAMFPVMSSVLTVFSHRSAGKEFAIVLLKGMQFGWYAFTAFCFTLAYLLNRTSIHEAFLIAITSAVITQLLSRRLVNNSQ